MIPTGWYSITLAVLILIGAALAFTGRSKSLRWPAWAMLASLVAARAATALPDLALPILLASTPLCAWAAYCGRSRAASIIAITYVPRLLCYAAFAFGFVSRSMMWEASNFFLLIQIAALFSGTVAGGHVAFDWLALGSSPAGRGAVRVPRATLERDRAV